MTMRRLPCVRTAPVYRQASALSRKTPREFKPSADFPSTFFPHRPTSSGTFISTRIPPRGLRGYGKFYAALLNVEDILSWFALGGGLKINNSLLNVVLHE